MMEWNFQQLLFCIVSWIHRGNRAPWNKKLMECFTVTKWNYYLQVAEVIICNDYKSLARFLNGMNANNKVNRWGLELATYNINFEWILRA